MADKAREWTDKELAKMERKIAKIYKQSEKEMKEKWNAYMERGEKRLAKYESAYSDALKSGDDNLISEAKKQLQDANKLFTLRNKYYKEMVDSVTLDMAKTNQMALSYIHEQLPEIYAVNYAQANEIVKNLDKKYTLPNKNAIKNMVLDGKIETPFMNSKNFINIPKDQRWNTKFINSEVLQGIIQGEDIRKISKRIFPEIDSKTVKEGLSKKELKSLEKRNRQAALRNARTLVTGAENCGKWDSFKELDKRGVVQKKVWIATGDSRTRDAHLMMDGQKVDLDEKFEDGNGDELRYPADPQAKARTVYNCRCAMVTDIVGFRNKDGTIRYIEDVDEGTDVHDEQIAKEIERRRVESEQKEKTKQTVNVEEKPVEKSEVLRRVEGWGIDYKEVKKLSTKLSEDQIIQKIGGGDMTTGSCTSLSFAYVGNQYGYDVTDFRGGDSTKFFSKTINIKDIASLPNVANKIVQNTNDFKAVEMVIKDLPSNKKFILSTGKHTAVIKREEDKFYYLELQSATDNGYHQLTNTTLRRRFGCQKSHSIYGQKLETSTILIDAESLGENPEFKNILGYINTATNAQKKGMRGHVR